MSNPASPSVPSIWDVSSPQLTHLTSPSRASRTSRRSRRRKDDCGESTDTIVDTDDTYRQGFPYPLRPLPLQHFIVEAGVKEQIQWSSTSEAITGLLQMRDVRWETVTAVNRRHPEAEPRPDDLTILITAQRDTSSDDWYLVLQDIHGYIQQQGLPPLRVEIYDPRRLRNPNNFIVESSHPLVSAWPNLSDLIINSLGSGPWLTLTAVRRGSSLVPEENPITILITSPDPSTLETKRESILSVCARAGFSVRLEIWKKQTVFGTDGDTGVVQPKDAFMGPIPMGSSISPETEDTSGTMGGQIVLTINNSQIQLGLTNFHVLRTPAIMDQVVDNGLSPEDSMAVRICAVVPSNQDTQCTLTYLQEMKSNLDEMLEKARESLELFHEKHDARKLRALENRCQEINEEVAGRQIKREAGFLWAASGFRIDVQTKFGLDWALIQLPSHRVTSNHLPTPDEVRKLRGMAGVYIPPDSGKLEEWSVERVRKGEMVYKKGRTTGLTSGKFNHIDPKVKLGGKICSAWQVVGKVDELFCRPGDSGSFILDSEGNWCGLLFAAPYHSDSGDGFVIPVDVLIADIQRLTGGTVSLP